MKRILITGIVIFGFTGISYAQNGVGIGTNNPQEKLDVDGAIKLGNTTTTNAGTIRWTGTAFEGYDGSSWVILSGGTASNNWTVSTNDIYTANVGNVGVGIVNPQQKLDVDGAIQLGTTTTATAGAIRWTGTTFEGYDGSQWVDLTGSGAFETTAGVTSNSPGDMANDDFVFGAPTTDSPASGAHWNRMFFDKSKGAFRVGGTLYEWDDANRGTGSFATGLGTTASGQYSVAMGSGTSASGFNSMATGANTTASGGRSFAVGNQSVASGVVSMALGLKVIASGGNSFVGGRENETPTRSETAFGQFSTTYTPAATNANAWNTADRLFSLGNGTSASNRSNALTIYKNGTMNINDAYDMPTADGTNGQVMTTDGSGVVTWQDASGGGSDWTVVGNDQYSSSSGNVGVGISTPVNKLDVSTARSGPFHPSDRPFYVTGNIGVNSNGPEIRHSNATQGIGFGYNTIYAAGTNANQHVNINPKGTGGVGIGTSFPSARLNITHPGDANQVKLDGGWSNNLNSNSRMNLNDVNFGIGAGNYSAVGGGDATVIWSYQGANRGILFASTLNGGGTTFRNMQQNVFISGSSGNMGIGTVTPSQKLHVEGNIRMVDGNEGLGKVLTSDANGNATWQVAPTDGDGDSSNELQDLSSTSSGTNRTINISGGTGTTISVADNDNDSSNEIQTLSQTGSNITLSNGGGTISVADNDNDSSNEIQTLSISGSDLTLSSGGGTVTLSGGAFETASNVTSNTPGNQVLDDFVFGSPQLADNGNSNHDRRMYFDKSSAAFRAGMVQGTQWDAANVGANSAAFGQNNRASGQNSVASGINTVASGSGSTASGSNTEATANSSSAGGYYTNATGNYSKAWGDQGTASGIRSTAWGRSTNATATGSTAFGYQATASGADAAAFGINTTASGYGSVAWGSASVATNHASTAWGSSVSSGVGSTAWGRVSSAAGNWATAAGDFANAPSYAEMAVGMYNTGYAPASTTSFVASDRLFTVGNGTSAGNRSDAMVVLKNGNTGFGTSTPQRNVHVTEAMRLEPSATAPSSPSAGDIYFSSTTNKLMVYDGSVWQACW